MTIRIALAPEDDSRSPPAGIVDVVTLSSLFSCVRLNCALTWTVVSWIFAIGTYIGFRASVLPTNLLVPVACSLAVFVAMFGWLVTYYSPKTLMGCLALFLNSIALNHVSTLLVLSGLLEQLNREMVASGVVTATSVDNVSYLINLALFALKVLPTIIPVEIAGLVISLLVYAFAHIRVERLTVRAELSTDDT